MKSSLDQLIQCLEQITQQLEMLEAMLAAVDPKPYQRTVTNRLPPSAAETGSVENAASPKFLDPPFQTHVTCSQACSSYGC